MCSELSDKERVTSPHCHSMAKWITGAWELIKAATQATYFRGGLAFAFASCGYSSHFD